jgi:hypothetical protein
VEGNIQNKSPSAIASGDWFPEPFLLTGKSSPNAQMAIIIVIIIGEANLVFHNFAYYSTISGGYLSVAALA